MKAILKQKIGTLLAGYLIDYLDKDPFERIESMLRFAAFLDIHGSHTRMIETTRRNINNREGRWSAYYQSFFTDLDRKVFKKFVSNLILKSIVTNSIRLKNRAKYGCSVPWAVFNRSHICMQS